MLEEVAGLHPYSGLFVVVDGLDGIGKGVILEALRNYAISKGKRVFDLHNYWRKHHFHPEFETFRHYDLLISSEPTYVGVGQTIRDELIAKTGRIYSAKSTAQAYALDRLTLYKRVILPALEASKWVFQSRSVSTSLAYQKLQAQEQGEMFALDEIMLIEGNIFALEHAPNLFIIPTIKNTEEVMSRLARREKDDKCRFENLDFQLKLKPLYESEELKNIFEQRGTIVKYLDAGVSIEHSQKEAVEILEAFLKSKGILL